MKKLIIPIQPALTNAENIRSMSDEELEIYLCDARPCEFCSCPGVNLCEMDGGKANGLLKWLRQPAEGTPIRSNFEDKTESGLLEED